MFTTRAEFRLTLRADNADARLTDRGIALGLVGARRAAAWRAKAAALDDGRALLRRLTLTPAEAAARGLKVNQDGQRRGAFDLLALPEITVARLAAIWPELAALPAGIADQLATEAGYAVYLARQAADIAAFRRDEDLGLPDDLDYSAVPGLSAEIRQRLQAVRPATLGQAGRLEGMTPAAATLLAVHARRASAPKASRPVTAARGPSS
jgi:tRNA uridine 5-carboxymethylaminomethyl modification enzyme